MKLREASDFIKSLLSETSKKSERKTCNVFIGILTDLEQKNLNEADVSKIEEELFRLNISGDPGPGERFKYLKQRLKEFKKFLGQEFGLIAEGHYEEEYMGMGIAFGMLFGLVVSSISMPVGLVIGMCIGLGIGKKKDEEAEQQNRVLKTKKHKNPGFQSN